MDMYNPPTILDDSDRCDFFVQDNSNCHDYFNDNLDGQVNQDLFNLDNNNLDDDEYTVSDGNSGNPNTFLMQWNCDGYFLHLDDVKLLIHDYDPCVVALVETHLKSHQTATLRSMNVYRKDEDLSDHENAKRGVLLAIRDDVFSEEIVIDSTIRLVVARVSFPRDLCVCCLYLPPGEALDEGELRDALRQIPRPFILCGDVNARSPLWGSDVTCPRGEILERLLEDFSLIPINDERPTHFSVAYGTYSNIDLTAVSNELAVLFDYEILSDLYNSDHYPIMLNLLSGSEVEGKLPRWNLGKADWDSYRAFIDLRVDLNPGQFVGYDLFLSLLNEAAESCIGATSSNSSRRPPLPWWGPEVKDAIQKRRRAHKNYDSDKSLEKLIELRRTRAKARFVQREAQKRSWQEYVNSLNCNTPPSEVWDKIRRLNGKVRHKRVSGLLGRDGTIVTDPKQKADLLASEFASNSSTEAYSQCFRRVKERAERRRIGFRGRDVSHSEVQFEMFELEEALGTCQGSSPGPDMIHYDMIKNLSLNAKTLLLRIFNDIWCSQSFPEQWREAIMIPILKPGKKPNSPNSYRPISLTNCMCKVMEKMVNKRLVWLLDRSNFFSSVQFGFRRKRGTSDLHVFMENRIRRGFRRRHHTVVVSLDLKKAYERVWRRHILDVLVGQNIRGNMYHFIEAFMRERRFRVLLGGHLSEWHSQENGVCQGSVLSVTLFLMAINGIVDCVDLPVEMCGYADDWYLIMSHSRMRTIEKRLQVALNRLQKWARRLGFEFSTEKTTAIHFCHKRPQNRPHVDPELKIGGEVIGMVNEMKILGVLFDRKLIWNKHIDDIAARAKRRLNLLRIVSSRKWGADEKTLLMMHQTLVMSILEYGVEVYSSASHTQLKKLDSVHNSGLRIAMGVFRTSNVDSIYALSGIRSLRLRRDERTLNHALKICCMRDHPLRNDLTLQVVGLSDRPRSFVERSRVLFARFNVDLASCRQFRIAKAPPWILSPLKFNVELSRFRKEDTAPIVFRQMARDLLREYRYYERIFTDGSVGEDRTGCAVVSGNQKDLFRLIDGASIFTAEKYAILKALESVKHSSKRRFLIVSDSLSVISSLRSMYSDDSLHNDVLELLHEIVGKEVVLLWVPSHVGIEGNTEADEHARHALTLGDVEEIGLGRDELRCLVRKGMMQVWKEEWDHSTSRLRRVKDDVRRWKSSDSFARRKQVVLARLRTGHTRLTHSYLMSRNSDPPQCGFCSDSSLTVDHLLFDCLELDQVRRDFGVSVLSLSNDSSQNEKLFNFLTSLDLFGEI